MDRIERLSTALLREATALLRSLDQPALASIRRQFRLQEVIASTALAGYRLDAGVTAALLERGIALGGHVLEAYEAVADYADAARHVDASDPRPLRPRTFLRADDMLELHRRAMRRTGKAPGAWRERNVPSVRSGLVPPPHWLVPREVASLVDRVARGPATPEQSLAWVALAHGRLLRVQPFDGGNGRVARLLANLLLRRLGLPPAAFPRRVVQRYRAALAAADGGDIAPLALLTGEAVRERLRRLSASVSSDGLRPLRELAQPRRVAALLKAAQRGRLRTVREGNRFLTTAAWLAEYEEGVG